MINTVATDLDGTLLNSHHHFNTALFTKVLARIKEAGGHLVIASGEQLDWCEQHFAEWQGQLAYVAANGAVVEDEKGRLVLANQLTADELRDVQQAVAANNLDCFIIGGIRSSYALAKSPGPFRQMIAFYYPHLKTIQQWSAVEGPVIKVAVAVPEQRERQAAAKLNQSLSGRLRAIVGGNGELDILTVGTGKASALQVLLDHFHTNSSHLLVFGDQLNDAGMFKLAGQSCAVANAVPEIKQLATKVIGTNDGGAVLKELAKRFDVAF